MTRTVVALYDDMQTAQRTVEELVNSGFRRDDISLVVTDREGGYRTAASTGVEEAAGGAAAGAGVGGILGGIAGLLVGLGALAIPGLGPLIAAGPLATALAGAGIGAAAGGLVGALVDAGIPEDQAGYYAEGIRRGGILVTARVDDAMHDQAAGIMNRYQPVNINDRAAEWRNVGWTGYDPGAGPYTDPDASGGAETTSDYYQQRGGISGGASGTTFEGTGDPTAGGTRGARGAGEIESRGIHGATGGTGMSGGSGATGGGSVTGSGASRPATNAGTSGSHERTSNSEPGSTFGLAGDDKQGTTRRMDSDEHSHTGSYGNRSGLDYTGAAGGTMGDSGAANIPSQRLGHEERSDSITTGTETGGTWEGGLGTGSGREHMRDSELGQGGEGRSQFGPTDEQTGITGSRFGDTGPEGGESSGSDVAASRTGQYGGGKSGQTDYGTRGQGAGSQYTNTGANRQDRTFGSGGGGEASSSAAYSEQWQDHFRESLGSTGFGFARYEPAYQFGHQTGSESRYSGRSWNDVESQVRTDWERSHPNDAWQDFKEAIRHAWERVRQGSGDLTD
jgi:hypothetical protein